MKKSIPFIFIVATTLCFFQCQGNEKTATLKSAVQAKIPQKEMLGGIYIPIEQIKTIIKQDSINGIAFDLTTKDFIDSSSIDIYEIQNYKVKRNTATKQGIFIGDKSGRKKKDGDKFKLDFSNKIDSFDFAYVSSDQLEPLIEMDVTHIVLSGITINFSDTFNKKGEFFTFSVIGVKEIKDKPWVQVAPKIGDRLPFFTLAAPCPPDWNPVEGMLNVLDKSMKEFNGNK